MFLGLLDPGPDPYLCLMDPDHQAKIVRKTLIPTVLWFLFDFISLKNYICKCTFKKQENFLFKIVFCWRLEGAGSGSGYISHRYGSTDLDPYQIVTDPQNCFLYICRVKELCWCSVERQVCGGWVRQRLRILAQHGIQSGES